MNFRQYSRVTAKALHPLLIGAHSARCMAPRRVALLARIACIVVAAAALRRPRQTRPGRTIEHRIRGTLPFTDLGATIVRLPRLNAFKWLRTGSLLWESGMVLTFGTATFLLANQPEIALQHWYVLTIPMVLAASRHGKTGALLMSGLSLIILIGAYQHQGDIFFDTASFLRDPLSVLSPEDAQRVALQIANLQVSDPTTTFQRSLLGFSSVVITCVLLGSKVDRLEELSVSDGLTGLANRRQFDIAIEQEWRRALRLRGPLSLLMIDVDHFKGYNDAFGHARGDECLQVISKTLQQAARRAGDLAARYGGEEFAILLPNTDESGITIMASAVRARVEELKVARSSDDEAPFVTISVGGACIVPVAGRSPRELIVAADDALYRGKTAGRNRVVIASRQRDMIGAQHAQVVEEQRT
jgi:diguanylate cyclase (GGDEF)-like protein